MKKLWILVLPLVVACSQNKEFKTESGVTVSYIQKGEGGLAQKDSIVLLGLSIKTEDGKAITETTADRPLRMAFDPALDAGVLQEVLNKLVVGDSVTFSITAANLFQNTYKTQVPPDMDSASNVSVCMKFMDQFSQEGYQAYETEMRQKMMEKEQAMLAGKIQSDGDSIDAYLAEKGIEAQKTESGIRYVITQQGNGTIAEAGQDVVVHYDGKLINGDRFDSSIERGNPFTFTIGVGQVIKGWDEGIPLISEGGKGTLYIPSPLGYGSRGAGPKIKPYSILVFDVEVLEVKK